MRRAKRAASIRYHGNVVVGSERDAAAFPGGGGPAAVPLPALREAFDAVIVACGARRARTLGVPGESLRGVATATSFVSWYNGEPGAPDPLEGLEFGDALNVVVAGQGNVALDCARVLAAAGAGRRVGARRVLLRVEESSRRRSPGARRGEAPR